jgi:hypothetical protein
MEDPQDGIQAIDRLMVAMRIGSAMRIGPTCEFAFRRGSPPPGNPDSNEASFDACVKAGHWKTAEPALMTAAFQHGVMATAAQRILDGNNPLPSQEVSLEAFIAAGKVVRAMCTAMCSRGQWCTWP